MVGFVRVDDSLRFSKAVFAKTDDLGDAFEELAPMLERGEGLEERGLKEILVFRVGSALNVVADVLDEVEKSAFI